MSAFFAFAQRVQQGGVAMNPDDITIRPVVYGNAVHPVHRETPSRDSTGGQRPSTREHTQAEEPQTTEDSDQTTTEPEHLIDLRA